MEKYGFVYIWRDKKHKRYYIGSHWGTECDKYICSSNWMRKSYYRRPSDFKRRIISRVYTNRKDLLLKEQEWFDLVKKRDAVIIKSRYYNINLNVYQNAWYSDKEKYEETTEKISGTLKEKYKDPEFKTKMDVALANRDFSAQGTPEARENKRQKMITAMAKKYPVENRSSTKRRRGDELTKVHSENTKNYWKNLDPEIAKIQREKMRQGQLGKQNRLGHTNSPEHRQKVSVAQRGKKISQVSKDKMKLYHANMSDEDKKKKSDKHKENMTGRIHIKNETLNKTMMIFAKDFEEYKLDGWSLGRLPFKHKKNR